MREFHFKFVERMWLFIGISLVAVVGSLLLISTKGLNLGTDFKGGIKLQYVFSQSITDGQLRKSLADLSLGDLSVQKIGTAEEFKFIIKTELQPDQEKLSQKMTSHLRAKFPDSDISLEQEESVGPKAGADLRKKAQLAIIVSWILMLIYIGYRFDFAFAPGAIVALIHDVLVTLGAFALTGREVSLTVIAALLTIIGYSVNDTIVIYDRIRENIPKMEKSSLRSIINTSINETLSRTIITNLTVFMVVILMYVFGEGEFQNFGFAMIVGAISGTYSTIYVASPCYIFLKELTQNKRSKSA